MLLFRWIAVIIATTFTSGFWIGALRGKSGAGGGLIGSVLALALQLYLCINPIPIYGHILLVAGSFLLGWAVIGPAEKQLNHSIGRQPRHTGEYSGRDYNATNIDEVHGQLVAGLPVFLLKDPNAVSSIFWLLICFVLFRIFDTAKPLGIKKVEEVFEDPFGIMFDDTIAGLYAALVAVLIMVMVTIS